MNQFSGKELGFKGVRFTPLTIFSLLHWQYLVFASNNYNIIVVVVV